MKNEIIDIDEIIDEIIRAKRIFPKWPSDPLHAVAVLQEEIGELTKELIKCTYNESGANWENVKEESIQTAAMALRFYINLDKYRLCLPIAHID